MRSLVDMQKKVEHKQQRDRERQLLRVREEGDTCPRILIVTAYICQKTTTKTLLMLPFPFVSQVQERLSIIQNRKSEEDLLGLKQKDRLRHLTHNLPQVSRPHTHTHNLP